MMNFRRVAAALVEVLETNAVGRFKVLGQRKQTSDASEFKGLKRRVQAYYANGDFPKSSGRNTGATQHVMTFNIDLQVSEAMSVDLATIQNPNTPAAVVAEAMDAAQDASVRADLSMDELGEIVYQILMDGRNYDLGFDEYIISNRWVTSLKKDDPEPQGGLMVLTGRIEYTCQCVEEITGDKGLAATGTTSVDIISTMDENGDDVVNAGVDIVAQN